MEKKETENSKPFSIKTLKVTFSNSPVNSLHFIFLSFKKKLKITLWTCTDIYHEAETQKSHWFWLRNSWLVLNRARQVWKCTQYQGRWKAVGKETPRDRRSHNKGGNSGVFVTEAKLTSSAVCCRAEAKMWNELSECGSSGVSPRFERTSLCGLKRTVQRR